MWAKRSQKAQGAGSRIGLWLYVQVLRVFWAVAQMGKALRLPRVLTVCIFLPIILGIVANVYGTMVLVLYNPSVQEYAQWSWYKSVLTYVSVHTWYWLGLSDLRGEQAYALIHQWGHWRWLYLMLWVLMSSVGITVGLALWWYTVHGTRRALEVARGSLDTLSLRQLAVQEQYHLETHSGKEKCKEQPVRVSRIKRL